LGFGGDDYHYYIGGGKGGGRGDLAGSIFSFIGTDDPTKRIGSPPLMPRS
jgi:hypothetical protein